MPGVMGRDLDGGVAMVVGAGSGIGRAAAVAFGQSGANVIVVNQHRGRGEETAELVRLAGGRAVVFEGDATLESTAVAMVDYAIDEFGRLDMAVNNVGGTLVHASIIDVTAGQFEQTFRFNTMSCFLALTFQISAMLQGGGGAIVNVASLAGLIGSPGLSAYVSAKHGVVGLTRTAALEFATRNVRVNAICPGATMTPRFRQLIDEYQAEERGLLQYWVEPMGRFGAAEEQGEAAVWLCSPASSFVTGQVLPVDGGHMAGNRATDGPDGSHPGAAMPS